MIKDVTVKREDRTVFISIRWQTDVCTEVRVTLKTNGDWLRTDTDTINLIRELTTTHTSKEIADHLNNLGIVSKKGLKFNRRIVVTLRQKYKMPLVSPQRNAHIPRADGRCSVRKAAETLNVSIHTDWCKKGWLDAIQSRPRGYLWIKLSPEKIAELRRART